MSDTYIRGKIAAAQKGQQTKHSGQGRIPPGQRLTPHMVAMPPITFDYPVKSTTDWSLELYGTVEDPQVLTWDAIQKLPQQAFTIDFHCVTTWSKLDQVFTGVDLHILFELVKPTAATRYVIFESYDGYTTNVPYQELLDKTCFLALTMDGAPIPPKYGGPARTVVPHLYGWKSAKFIQKIRFQAEDEPGFWETRGYHNHADPWEEERFDEDY